MSVLHCTCRLVDFRRRAESCSNPQFLLSTRGLKRTFCRLPESLLGMQTSADFTDLIAHNSLQYRCDTVGFFFFNRQLKTFKTILELCRPEIICNNIVIQKYIELQAVQGNHMHCRSLLYGLCSEMPNTKARKVAKKQLKKIF